MMLILIQGTFSDLMLVYLLLRSSVTEVSTASSLTLPSISSLISLTLSIGSPFGSSIPHEAREHGGINGPTPSTFLQTLITSAVPTGTKQRSVTHVGNQICNLFG
jgi:hypothetical protein